ncbi:MAG: heavy metal-binding domain-containing protein [Paenibacillus dendritiformis]|uniref:heavy metal-binding domain-containing protein n=1 Tax=uncultured Paenibacillus sp. TaxID=227322 RepID=UPI0025F73993|nr:heavy metal-binding domain-containing protein [uncultured Paenibacillus sp.]MDU5144438.1 heavy metal-binding domain-containing protein [Paenibacillus dendritiformis]
MIIVTTERPANRKVREAIGPVFGLTVRSRGIGKDIAATLKGLVGGEIRQYTEMLEDARKQALDRMVANARTMGANGIVMVRFDSGEAGNRMSEIVAYGTAVILEEETPC